MTAPHVVRLVGVYDADGTVLGELTYFVKARIGRAHCALCDITHGRVRERADWRAARDALGVPFETYHRDDQPDAVRRATGDTAPVVVAELADGTIEVVATPAELESCDGEPARLIRLLERRIR